MTRPWMPLYIADYRKDTAHLGASEHGAYLLLIMHYWASGSLPDDNRQLARIAAMSPAEWKRARPIVQAFFHDGWKHKRVDDELRRTAEVAETYASRARQAAEKRWSKHASSNAPSIPQASIKPCLDMPSSQPQSQEESSSLRSEARKRASRLPSDWVPTSDDFEFAHSRELPHAQIKIEAEKFRNYWTAKGGKDAAKLDWPATWRNWILNAIERKGNSGGTGTRGNGSRSAAGDFFAGIAEVAANIGGDDRMAGPADAHVPRGRVEIDH